MKRYFLAAAAISAICIAGCKKSSFVSDNTDPSIVSSIDPREQFTNASSAFTSSVEWYYDSYINIMPWSQQLTGTGGNAKTFLTPNNFNQRYSKFFPTIGGQLTDIQQLVDLMAESKRAEYTNILAIADIYKVYYAYYVMDIIGSMPYTDAFKGRYAGTLTPDYQSQQELFAIFETSLKQDIATLKTTQPVAQVALDVYDQFYKGSATAWVKAANALRLRLAFRLLKRDEATAKGIITDVLNSGAGDLMSSNADSWNLWLPNSSIGGDYDPTAYRAPRPTVDFMWKNNDPRIRNFYQKNNYTQDNMNLAIAAKVYPAGTTVSDRRYIGATTSPDSALGKYQSWFLTKLVSNTLTLDTVSYIKYRLWKPDYTINGVAGTGIGCFPLLSYAEFCFLKAEAILKGYVSGSVEEWYNAGITSSITAYDDIANKAKLEDYTALGNTEISGYLNSADVKFNATKAAEQLAIQAYINFYKQPSEAWAVLKRTGMPNSSTALANENITINGTVFQMPRRAAFGVPLPTDLDYATRTAAIAQMMTDAEYGTGATDVFGRVWWDKK